MLIVKKIYYSKFVSCSVSYFIKKLYNCVQYSGILLYTHLCTQELDKSSEME